VADPRAARAPARTPGWVPIPVSFLALVLVAALPASLAGCAARPMAAPPVPRPAPPAASAPVAPPPERPSPGPQVGTTASGGSITIHQAPVPAVLDSTPSEDALAVLRTIPEPLRGEDSPDTVRVPVPAPTQPLGERPGTRPTAALPESLAASTDPRSPAAPPGVTAGARTARADSCWRVQVLAPPERERAERMAEVARSQLLIPFVIEREGGLFKVRSRDCLSAGAAGDLSRRAVESGLAGAFRFRAKPR